MKWGLWGWFGYGSMYWHEDTARFLVASHLKMCTGSMVLLPLLRLQDFVCMLRGTPMHKSRSLR